MEPGRGETLNGSLVKLWGNAVISLTNLTEPLFWEVYEVICVTTFAIFNYLLRTIWAEEGRHIAPNNWFKIRNLINSCRRNYWPSHARPVGDNHMLKCKLTIKCFPKWFDVHLWFSLFSVWMVRVQVAVTSWSLGAMELQWNLHSKSTVSFHYMSIPSLALWHGNKTEFHSRVLLHFLFKITKQG